MVITPSFLSKFPLLYKLYLQIRYDKIKQISFICAEEHLKVLAFLQTKYNRKKSSYKISSRTKERIALLAGLNMRRIYSIRLIEWVKELKKKGSNPCASVSCQYDEETQTFPQLTNTWKIRQSEC